MNIPNNSKPITVDGATVEFYEYEENGLTTYIFDTSECTPPHPMMNAMMGLQLLDNENKQLIMLNHSIPNGLFPRIESNFDFDIDQTKEGLVKVVFKYKKGSEPNTDFDNNQCGGC